MIECTNWRRDVAYREWRCNNRRYAGPYVCIGATRALHHNILSADLKHKYMHVYDFIPPNLNFAVQYWKLSPLDCHPMFAANGKPSTWKFATQYFKPLPACCMLQTPS